MAIWVFFLGAFLEHHLFRKNAGADVFRARLKEQDFAVAWEMGLSINEEQVMQKVIELA